MNDLESSLESKLKKMKEEGISLKKAKDLYFEAKEEFLSAEEEKKTGTVLILAFKIFQQAGIISENFISKWQSGKIVPTDKELDLLKEGCEETLSTYNYFKENFSSLYSSDKEGFDKRHSLVKKRVQEVEELIQKEKSRRQRQEKQNDSNQSSSVSSDLSNGNDKNSSQLSQKTENLQRQLNSLIFQQQNQPKTTTEDNIQLLKEIQRKLNDLQDDLQNIERKQSQNPTASRQEKQELAKLKSELSELQNQLKQSQNKQSQQQTSSNKSEFNWLYIVVPSGVLLVISGIIIAYLLGKNQKKE